MRSLLRNLCILALGLGGAAAHAHEFWVEPSAYRITPGDLLRVELRNGERFRGETVPRPAEVVRFEIVGAAGVTPIIGRGGGAVSVARPSGDGLQTVVYRSVRMTNRLDGPAFDAYLREEGLDAVADLRAGRGEQTAPGREVYERCAKALVAVGDPGATGHDRVVGLPLEIVLETTPDAAGAGGGGRAGGAVVARVLYAGAPLAGVTVVAVSVGAPERLTRRTTDADGRVVFSSVAAGPCMLTTIHMVPAPADVDADWESFWASLTFER